MQLKSKCCHDRIFFATRSGPRIMLRTCGESWHSVSSWQWSGLSCEIRIMSGSGMSCSDLMADGVVCSWMLNFCEMIVAGPSSQGSMRMVKAPGKSSGDLALEGVIVGAKVRRKEVSLFRALMVSAMVGRLASA